MQITFPFPARHHFAIYLLSIAIDVPALSPKPINIISGL